MNDHTIVDENVTPPARPARGPGRAVGLVPFLFGAARRDRLPGLVLTRLLGDLGQSESAARGLLARMRREGQIAGVREGRQTHYELAGNFAAAFRRMRDGVTVPEWRGHFHVLLHQVPEDQRAYRDRLRRHARFVGYGTMQPGVLVCAEDRVDRLADVLEPRPPGAVVHTGRLLLDVGQAREVAGRAWELDELAVMLRGHRDRLLAALEGMDGAPGPSPETLRAYAGTVGPAYGVFLRVPVLPSELMPGDWPLPETLGVLGRVVGAYSPPTHAYIESLLGGAAQRR
ncbi:hypothetical protein [Actinorhabdospora filicis]|nr:hypothetical protein [Actinorhabdospora filicis]